jgi:hypothetical protein
MADAIKNRAQPFITRIYTSSSIRKHTMRRKRRAQPTTEPCVGETALSISRLCRHVTLVKSKQYVVAFQSRPPPEPVGDANKHAVPTVTLDSLHWQQTASTLLSENTQLRESLKTKEKECSDYSSRLFQLGQSHASLEKQLAASTRDLLVSTVDSLTPPPMVLRAAPNIPVNTQGKDAMYWHQACRTLQAQYLELKSELENKTDQLLRLTTSYHMLLRGGECPRGTETRLPRGRLPASTGCANGAP